MMEFIDALTDDTAADSVVEKNKFYDFNSPLLEDIRANVQISLQSPGVVLATLGAMHQGISQVHIYFIFIQWNDLFFTIF